MGWVVYVEKINVELQGFHLYQQKSSWELMTKTKILFNVDKKTCWALMSKTKILFNVDKKIVEN
jgi:hypothetical protein